MVAILSRHECVNESYPCSNESQDCAFDLHSSSFLSTSIKINAYNMALFQMN